MMVAARLRCSIATQARFSSAALIAYMWNEITSRSVGGLRITFFFSTFSLPQSLTLGFCLQHFFFSPLSFSCSIFISLFPCDFFFLHKSTFTEKSPTHPFPFPVPSRFNFLGWQSVSAKYLALQRAGSLPTVTPLKETSLPERCTAQKH